MEQAKDTGYLVKKDAPKDFFMEGYFRLDKILKERASKARISDKIRGGTHSGKHDPHSSCVRSMLSFDDLGRNSLFEKELDHPDYSFLTVKRLFTLPKRSEIIGKWIGKITYTRVQSDGTTYNAVYVNLDPFDVDGNIKYQNYNKYYEYVDDGKDNDDRYKPTIANWSGKITTWRINEFYQIDFTKLSIRALKK
jgi:hypothetical protein